MKKNIPFTSLILAAFVTLVALTSCVSAPVAAPVAGLVLPSVQVSPQPVTRAANQQIRFAGAGFAPNSEVAILVDFAGSLNDVASYTANGIRTNEQGAFVAVWTLIAYAVNNLPAGVHTATIMVADDVVRVPIVLVAP